MILGNVRQCLTRGDAQLAMRLIARGSSAELDAFDARLRDEGIDAILDDPRLRGYRLAAAHRLAAQHGVQPLFEHAADRFGRLRVALNRVSDGIVFARHHSASKLMRQVRDEARWVA